MLKIKLFCCLITLNCILINSVNADLILTSPPRESAERGEKQYKPLADLLTIVLNEKVTYEHPKGWLYYQRDMRADKFDIIFDGPHFISWRIKKLKHTPLAKLPGRLSFVVIANKNNIKIQKLDDLINKKICAIAPPNLATMSIQSEFTDPVMQPIIVPARRGGMKGVYRLFKQNKCEVAVLRDQFYYKKVPEKDKQYLKIVFKTKKISNQGVSVSSRVTENQQVLIRHVLTHNNEGVEPTLKRFAPRANAMLPANEEEYKNYYKLLTGIIFGWELIEDQYSYLKDL